MKILLKNGRVVDPASETDAILDLLIDGERISAIGSGLSESGADRIIDLSGLIVAPGLVDMHVHLRDPGLEYKEDIESGSRAAIMGGFTTVACMSNTSPICDDAEIVSYIIKKAESVGGAKVYPIAASTVSQKGETLCDYAALKKAGAVAVSDDGFPVESAATMADVLERAGREGLAVISHCEDLSLVRGGVMNEGETSKRLGFPGIPRESEEVMVAREAVFAMAEDRAVHIAHVSTRGSVEIVRAAKRLGAHITCETCPHYMLLTDEEVEKRGANAKMNPPLRTARDVSAILDGLCDGTIDAIATDHAPHASHEKGTDLKKAANGVVGLETSLGAVLTALYKTGRMDLADIIAAMSLRPAQILGIPGGRLYAGGAADITVFDPDEIWRVNAEIFVSKGRNTPFDGMEFTGKARFVFVDGRAVLDDGKLMI